MKPNGASAHSLVKLWQILTPDERRRALTLLFLMFIGMLLETLGISLVIPVFHLISRPDFDSAIPGLRPIFIAMGNPRHETIVVVAVIMLVVVYLFKGVFLAFLSWREMRFAFGLQAEISQRLFATYLGQPYTFHLQRNSAELIRNIIGEVAQLIANCILPALVLVAETLVLIGLCVLLLAMEPLGALVVLAVVGIAGWGFHRLSREYLTQWGATRQIHEGLRLQHLQEGLGGAKDVLVLGREQEFLNQYAEHNMRTARVTQLQKTLQQLPRLWLEILAISGLAVLVLVMLAQGRALNLIVPILGLFAAAAFRLLPSANRIISAIQSLRYGMPVIDILHAELQLAPMPNLRESRKTSRFGEALTFHCVSYTYPNAPQPALFELSLRINRGESVGVIGSSGAGKSTLVDILLGLLSPDCGSVRVDGIDIRQNLRQWQDQIGYVPQTIFLSDDSLRRNIAFGVSEKQIDEQAIRRVIHAAQLEALVNTLPQGLDTPVGERGVRLSGGQRQRIGIARALYHDPAVLILDEATSALDVSTEQDVMHAIRALHGSKTIVIVAHRLSTVAHCDRIYHLEHGKLEREGPAESLIGK